MTLCVDLGRLGYGDGDAGSGRDGHVAWRRARRLSGLIDVASYRAETRSVTIAAEFTVGASGAATLAAMIAHGLYGNVIWVAVAAAIGAAGVVARWRQVAF